MVEKPFWQQLPSRHSAMGKLSPSITSVSVGVGSSHSLYIYDYM